MMECWGRPGIRESARTGDDKMGALEHWSSLGDGSNGRVPPARAVY
jgi:hypothetical protein